MPTLHQFARQLRLQQTDCERLIWQKLRARQVLDLKFRRQHPCPPYVLDFYCVELQLAVELDGSQHFTPEQRSYDQQRSEYLNSQGIEVGYWQLCFCRYTNITDTLSRIGKYRHEEVHPDDGRCKLGGFDFNGPGR